MREPFLVVVERDREHEDLLTVLDRDDAPRGEALAVAAAVDLVNDRHLGIAADEEIRVQRMWRAALHGADRRDQRLPDHLSAEHALPAILWAPPAKQVHLDLLEVEHVEHGFDGSFGHGVLAVIVEHAARRERMSRRALLRRDEAAILI